jgi:enoyl-CoA hydratase/carnithine racemase
VAEAQEYGSRLAVEIGVEQKRVRKAEKEKEEQVRQLNQAPNTVITVVEELRKDEQEKLETERILAEERQHAETLVLEKAEAHEGIRGLTPRIEKLE